MNENRSTQPHSPDPHLQTVVQHLRDQARADEAGIRARRARVAQLTRAAQLLQNRSVLALLHTEQEQLAAQESRLAEVRELLVEPKVQPTEPEALDPLPSKPAPSAPEPRAPESSPPPAVATPVAVTPAVTPAARLSPALKPRYRDTVVAAPPGPLREHGPRRISTPPVTAIPIWAPPERYVRSTAPPAPLPCRLPSEEKAPPILLQVAASGPDPELERIVAIAGEMPRRPLVVEPARPLAQLEALLESTDRWLLQACRGGELGLLLFRARLAEFRQAARERATHRGDESLWREQLKVFVGKRGQYFATCRMDELDWQNELTGAEWERRAAGYRATYQAAEAILWVETVLDRDADPKRHALLLPVLESATALILPFQRWLEQGKGELSDPVVRNWGRRAQEAAARLGERLQSVRPYTPEEALQRLAARLEERLGAARQTFAQQERVTELFEELAELVTRPGFTDQEAPLLCQCVAALRGEGIPASHPELTALLVEHIELLRHDSRVPVQETCRAVSRKIQQETAPQEKGVTTLPAEAALDAETRRKLAEVVRYTRGKVFLMVGGVPDRQRRKTLEELLEVEEFRWPRFALTTNLARYAQVVGRADVDLFGVNKWNSCHVGEFKTLARKFAKPMVLFNKGLGIRQVIDGLYEWVIVYHERRGTTPALTAA